MYISTVIGWNVLYLSIKSIWTHVLYKTRVSLHIFHLDYLSIDGNGVLKSPSMIVLLSVSPFMSVNIFCMYLGVLMLGAYIYYCYSFFLWGSFATACKILVPWPRIKPVPHTVEAQSLNHWTVREIPVISSLDGSLNYYVIPFFVSCYSLCFDIYPLLLLLLSHFSRVRLLATPWTAAHQAPPSMGFSRQEYWSGVPLPSLIYTLLSIK